MKRVLIISPRFPPVNAPDHQRVRMSLPYFSPYGWEPTVLALTPEPNEGAPDPQLAASLPPDIRVEYVTAWPEEKVRRFGFGQIDYRCLLPLYRVGTKLLREQPYDVIYFSTTVFLTLVLARLWKKRFGCRIVFDFQDPWYQGPKIKYSPETAPGGWTKYRLAQTINKYGEAFALKAADHIISVSPGYVSSLSQRYPWLTTDTFTVIPFGGAPRDYESVRELGIHPQSFCPGDGLQHWVYVGRGGADMDPVLEALFRSLARLRETSPELTRQIRLHFVGTNYSPRHRTFNVIQPIADRCGVGDLVDERSVRIPYFQAVAEMAESDAVMLIGSTTKEYTASKFFSCVLSRKPVLALFHEDSLICQLAPQFPNVRLAKFHRTPDEPEFQNAIAEGLRWLADARFDATAIEKATEPYSARHLTAAQCEVFDKVVSA